MGWLPRLGIAVVVVVVLSAGQSVFAVTLTFKDDPPNSPPVYDYLGVYFTNIRVDEDTTYPPYVDGKGIHYLSGSYNTMVVSFATPVDYVEMDAWSLGTETPQGWTIIARDLDGTQVDVASFTDVRPPDVSPPYWFDTTLRVEAVGQISRIEFDVQTKLGIDTIRFGSGVIPEPATLALLALGGLGVLGRGVRRRTG